MVFGVMNETIERFVKEICPDLHVFINDGRYMKQIIIENRKEKIFCERMIFEWDPNRMFVRNEEG